MSAPVEQVLEAEPVVRSPISKPLPPTAQAMIRAQKAQHDVETGELKREIQQLRDQFTTRESELIRELTALRQERETDPALRRELLQESFSVSSLTSQIRSKDNEIESLKQEVRNLTTQLAASNDELRAQSVRVQEQQRMLEVTEKDLRTRSKQNDETRLELEKLTQQARQDSIQNDIDRKRIEEERGVLRNKIQAINIEKSRLANQVERQSEELERLTQQAREYKVREEALEIDTEKKLSAANNYFESLQQQLAAQSNKIANYEARLDECEQFKARYNQAFFELKRILQINAEYEARLAEYETEVEE